MAHNSTLIRKAKTTRLENPSIAQTYRQQVDEYGPSKDKISKVSNNRRTKTSKQQMPEPPKDIIHNMSRMSNPFDMAQSSKNAIRVAGGGGAAVTSKYQSRVTLNSQPSKTVRPSVTTASFQKLTPKEIKELKETKEFKVFKEPKEIRCFKEPKELKELREHKEQKEPRELKEPKEPKETKDPKVKGADKSPHLSHRSTRHNTNRTKNYFDKYLKFAFDLSTPEGVKKLEDHFFPNQIPNATGSLNPKQEE
ncbi:small ribosomal subunit protein bS6 [Drosophila takahashii]|uniref:small ribosomal subunit protein bS6 n=1 Tax=Drosophila takahashii TaxID=29030 RepID=UPI001CF9114A|nr:uncharacterized protein LOC108055318 [Drosophila takahashii]